jgi:hypothetical protein
MVKFFCSENSRFLNEQLIGTAAHYKTYVLIEHLFPWAKNAFDSKDIPSDLKALIQEFKEDNNSTSFLLINRGESNKTDYKKVIIYSRKEGLSDGYKKQEFEVENVEKFVPILKDKLLSSNDSLLDAEESTRDILVCTHGVHDKCCAKYGKPFYKGAKNIISDLSLDKVRIWQASHFGGHRFAPTIIDFPSGRYYGLLDSEIFKSILIGNGDINRVSKAYRGWAKLPPLAQTLERELLLLHHWDWLNFKVDCKLLEYGDLKQVELIFETSGGNTGKYTADIFMDDSKTIYTKSGCDSDRDSKFIKYSVRNIYLEQ